MLLPHQLYAFGSNGSGQLGLGHCDDVFTPTFAALPSDAPSEPPSRIAAGGNHTLILFPSGAVYAAGENVDGRCGLPGASSASTFKRVAISQPEGETCRQFTFCAATWEASILVTRQNQVCTFGSGHKGELGHGDSLPVASEPKCMTNFPPEGLAIVDLEACMSHVIAVLSNGDVYGWGNGRKGQLGGSTTVNWSPLKIEGLDFPVVRAVCGREFTYLVGHPEQGRHVILGSDKYFIRSGAPSSIRQWQGLTASWGSIFVSSPGHTLKSWGRDDHGQLGPNNLPPLKAIAAGSEHVLGLTEQGCMLAWGWGEHGNTGLPKDEAAKLKGRWNEILGAAELSEASSGVRMFGAGCATSWIWIG